MKKHPLLKPLSLRNIVVLTTRGGDSIIHVLTSKDGQVSIRTIAENISSEQRGSFYLVKDILLSPEHGIPELLHQGFEVSITSHTPNQ